MKDFKKQILPLISLIAAFAELIFALVILAASLMPLGALYFAVIPLLTVSLTITGAVFLASLLTAATKMGKIALFTSIANIAVTVATFIFLFI